MTEALLPGDVFYTGKTFNLFLRYAFQAERPQYLKTEIKLRPKGAVTPDEDLLMGVIKTSAMHYNDLKQSEALYLACRSKEELDKLETYKQVLGCASTVGSVFCFMGTTATGGAAGILCEAVWSYAFDTGAADCVESLQETILGNYADHPMVKAIETLTNIKDGNLKDMAADTLDMVCKDVKTNEGYVRPEPAKEQAAHQQKQEQKQKSEKEFHGGLVIEKQDKEKHEKPGPDPVTPDKDPIIPDKDPKNNGGGGGNNNGGGDGGKKGGGDGGKKGGGGNGKPVDPKKDPNSPDKTKPDPKLA